MRSTLFSVAVHVLAIGTAVVWSGLAPGVLPSPRQMFAFQDFDMVKIADIPLPPARRAGPPAPAISNGGAPIEPPPHIGLERTIDASSTATGAVGEPIGVDYGLVTSLPGLVDAGAPPPPPPPRQPVRLHSGMQAPRKIVDMLPVYPRVAQIAHVGGVVILEAVIDARGSVESVRVLRSVSMLDLAAVEAVKQWRFTPARLNGEVVPVVMTVTVQFKLN